MVIWRTILVGPHPAMHVPSTHALTLIERLSPLNQLRVIVGLFAVVILGIVIFIVIKAGAHMAKGFSAAANRLSGNSLPDEHDWTNRPLIEAPDDDDE